MTRIVRTGEFTAFAFVVALVLTGCTQGTQPVSPSSAPTSSAAPTYSPAQDSYTPVVVSVLNAPVATAATDEMLHLAYELQLTNASGVSVTISSVTSDIAGVPLQSLQGDALSAVFRAVGTGVSRPTLGPGQAALVWMDGSLPVGSTAPTTIDHTITVEMPEANLPMYGTTVKERPAAVPVSETQPIEISSPLRGSRWVDANGCCDLTPHRLAISPINGQFNVPERWAIDWVQLTGSNALFSGDKTKLESYPTYGNDILAVADGPIVAMTTDRPEQVPGTNPTGLTLDEFGGNYIVQDIGGGHFAFYAHLEPGNPKGVTVGQVLRQGDTIALLGNTGNSDAPHLHFHIMDSPSPLASNGLPFLIDHFTLSGTVPSADDIEKGFDGTPYPIEPAGAGARTAEAPLIGTVMTY